jgi:hypothetical protein
MPQLVSGLVGWHNIQKAEITFCFHKGDQIFFRFTIFDTTPLSILSMEMTNWFFCWPSSNGNVLNLPLLFHSNPIFYGYEREF